MLKLHPWNLKLCHFQGRNHLSTPMSIYLRWKGDNFLGGRTVFLLDGGSFLDETSMTQQTWLSEETWAVSKSSWWIPWLRWLWILPNASNVSIIHEVWLEWRNSTFIPKNEQCHGHGTQNRMRSCHKMTNKDRTVRISFRTLFRPMSRRV